MHISRLYTGPDGQTHLEWMDLDSHPELATLQTKFEQNVLKEKNASSIVVDRREDLAGLSEHEIAAAAAAGLNRTIAGWVPHFSAIAPVLADSDLIATLPAVAMTDTLRPYGLDSRSVPFPIDPLPHAILWSAQRGRDPEIAWLRDQLRPIVKSKFAGGSPSRR